MLSAGQRISTPQDIHACLVCDLHVADLSIVYLYDGVPKQVRHDGIFEIKTLIQQLSTFCLYRFQGIRRRSLAQHFVDLLLG
jgi:hypothetical protein